MNPNRTKHSFEQHKSQHWAQLGRNFSDLPQEAGPVDLVECFLKVHLQKASSFCIAVAVESSSHGLDKSCVRA